MFFVVYVSSAVTPFTRAELHELLARSVENNTRLGLTGMLLYKDGNFMQVLEGDEAVVQSLYAKIHKDPRHRGVIKLMQGKTDERQFPDWSMGFRDLSSAEAQAAPGFNEFMNTPLTAAEFASDASRCRKLLMVFKKSM